jgi:hypothetical protein
MKPLRLESLVPPLAFPGAVLVFSLSLVLAGAILVGCNDSTSPGDVSACSDDPGSICTWAGNGVPGFDGGGHLLTESSFYWPSDLTIASDGTAYIMDWNNHAVRRVMADGTLQTVIGTSTVGDGPLPDSPYTDLVAPGAPGTEISLNHPTQMAEMDNGIMLLSSWHNHKLRTYDPSTGLVFVVCGSGAGFGGDSGMATNALLNQPGEVEVTALGEIYVMDQRNQRIRKIDTNNVIHSVVGTGVPGYSGDGGAPLDAQLNFPTGSNPQPATGLALDSQGRLYISDTLNHRVRQVDFTANTIITVAGTGEAGFSGDGGPGTLARINNPRDIEIGPDGRLYIADELNHRVRAVDMGTGFITTVAGNGTAGFSGDGGAAVNAALNRPQGLDFDSQGRLYIVDTFNNRIRRVTL